MTLQTATPGSTLGCTGLSVHFGGVKAVDEVDFCLVQGEIVGLIGPNGAGKSTLVNAVTGFQRPTSGSVRLGSCDITGWSSRRRVRTGLVRTFQAVRLFTGLTVLDNLVSGALGVGLSPRRATERATEIAEALNLADLLTRSAASLPHGVERRVGIARALTTRPRFLMLDEPAAGLNEAESDELGDLLHTLRDRFGCGVCLIEHDMRLVMSRCERIQVLDSGRTIAEGTPDEIQNAPEVIAAYLGAP
jgi:branched-chain amino acid transport system ATP-binding protein